MPGTGSQNICGHCRWRAGLFSLLLDSGWDLVTALMGEYGRVILWLDSWFLLMGHLPLNPAAMLRGSPHSPM